MSRPDVKLYVAAPDAATLEAEQVVANTVIDLLSAVNDGPLFEVTLHCYPTGRRCVEVQFDADRWRWANGARQAATELLIQAGYTLFDTLPAGPVAVPPHKIQKATPLEPPQIFKQGPEAGAAEAEPETTVSADVPLDDLLDRSKLNPQRMEVVRALLAVRDYMTATQLSRVTSAVAGTARTILREFIAAGVVEKTQLDNSPVIYGYRLTVAGREAAQIYVDAVAESEPVAQDLGVIGQNATRRYIVTVAGETPEAAALIAQLKALEGVTVVAESDTDA